MEGLCSLLRHLAYPNRLVDMAPLFGHSEQEMSVIVNRTLEAVHAKHADKLSNIFQPWVEHAKFAHCVFE